MNSICLSLLIFFMSLPIMGYTKSATPGPGIEPPPVHLAKRYYPPSQAPFHSRRDRTQPGTPSNVPIPSPISTRPTTPPPAVRQNERIAETGINVRPPLLPKKSEVIVIDPGHGGDDFGTHSNSKPRYQEKSLNLTTSMQLKGYLEQLGYQTIMTRKNDVFIELSKRAEFANEKKPTLFVSVHYNSAPSRDAEGVEVYYYQHDENKKRVSDSKKLAQSVLKHVLGQTQAKSRGVKHGNFAVIRETQMPAILIEGGFLTNDEEMAKIKNPAYIKQLAWGIAKGIDAYLQQ